MCSQDYVGIPREIAFGSGTHDVVLTLSLGSCALEQSPPASANDRGKYLSCDLLSLQAAILITAMRPREAERGRITFL